MPPNITLVADVEGERFFFNGELGLALGWLLGPLDVEGQGWVTACMLARVNANDVALPISMRGSNPGLGLITGERDIWTVEEGAFFGNLFAPLDQPIQWYACRGAGQAVGEFGGLISRDCAEEDPEVPGETLCGFNFAGDCGAFAATHSCEQFSGAGTFYAQCHIAGPKSPVFQQVITTYVTP